MTPTSDRRPKAAVPLTSLVDQLRIDATEIAGWGAGNEAEHIRQGADEIEQLREQVRLLRDTVTF
jgi:hypothetical protein